jgi:5-(aminomethyl)-3-furanmethanol phosphate kinase
MMHVMKLGGSLSNDDRLVTWLEMLAVRGRGRVVIVPGGGPYADIVRAQQQRWRFSDADAHRLAVLAMDQFALQMQGMKSELALTSTRAEILEVIANNQAAIWLPSAMVLSEKTIAMSWDITSDSLAAWLASLLGADRLTLVKSCDIAVDATIGYLAQQGIVDRGFMQMTTNAPYEIQIISASDHARIESQLIQSSD